MNISFLPTFPKICPGGVHIAQTVVPFAHFQVQTRKRGALWWAWGCFRYVHIPERSVWRLSKEQRLMVVFCAKWDPIWAKWDPIWANYTKNGQKCPRIGKKKCNHFFFGSKRSFIKPTTQISIWLWWHTNLCLLDQPGRRRVCKGDDQQGCAATAGPSAGTSSFCASSREKLYQTRRRASHASCRWRCRSWRLLSCALRGCRAAPCSF